MRNINDIKDIPNIHNGDKPIMETVALGTGTAMTICCFYYGGKVHLAVERHGYYTFTHYVHPSYMEEKIISNPADAEAVSNWLNKVMNWG